MTLNQSHDIVELSLEDLFQIFNLVVDNIMKLIDLKLREAFDSKAMMVVDGFSSSFYLVKRIWQEFYVTMGSTMRIIVI